MSKHPEPSYYEVALTSRQVAAGFIVLLACLVAAFFSGVWVGQSGQARADQGAAVRRAGDAAGLDLAAGEGAEVPDLEFFAGEDSAEAVSAAAPEASSGAGTTLAEDLEARAVARGAAAAAPAPAAGRTGTAAGGSAAGSGSGERPIAKWKQERQAAKAALQQETGEEDDETADAPPRARPAEPAPSAPATPAPAAPAAAAGSEVFVIQVLSSRDQDKARQVLSWLRDGGYPASLSTTEQGGQLMYRVRVGPYGDRAGADRVADEVRRKFKLDTWVTPE